MADVPKFEEWLRRRFGPELMTLGVPGSTSIRTTARAGARRLLSLVGVTGNSDGRPRQARDLAPQYIDDPSSLPGTLASTVLSVAAVGGDAMLYDRYMAQLPKLSGSRGVLPLLSRAAVVPRPGARTAESWSSRSARRATQDAPTLIGP